MLVIKKLLVLSLLMPLTNLYGQVQFGIGYTVAWLNSKESIAGGASVFMGRNISERPNSSFSISTNVKIGIEDKIGTGLVIPLFFAMAATNNHHISSSSINNNTDKLNGGKIHLFTDFPLLLHYNFGLGSNKDCNKKFGFYLGGGISYTTTGYTDTLGFSKGTGFFGCVIDGGIRVAESIDINYSNVISLRKPIGAISHPIFFEITLSLLLGHKDSQLW